MTNWGNAMEKHSAIGIMARRLESQGSIFQETED